MAKKKEKPLTRKDVLKRIEENGGTANGLDLSGKVFERNIDLSGCDLTKVILDKAILRGANFQKATLHMASLKEVDLFEADLEGADLFYCALERAKLVAVNLERTSLANANLERATLADSSIMGADLYRANLKSAKLANTDISSDTNLRHVDWGNYILEEERDEDFYFAEESYRKLKMWHTNAGMYDIAGEFFYREMVTKTKGFWHGEELSKPLRELFHPIKPKEILSTLFPRRPFHWAWSMLINLLCGYGERPFRVVASAAVVVLGLALIYFGIGTLMPNTFLNSLYYSAVSFTALGYGRWASEPTGWVKGLGAFEAFVGVFMIALFLVTFVRKWTR